jgi:hypothetical protein
MYVVEKNLNCIRTKMAGTEEGNLTCSTAHADIEVTEAKRYGKGFRRM